MSMWTKKKIYYALICVKYDNVIYYMCLFH